MKDPNVKAILINIFGGIVRCDRVAAGVIEAYNKLGNINIPIIVRLQGTNAEAAKELIQRRPNIMIERAVKGMLPKNRLGRAMHKKLFVYEGAEHPHKAQKPQELKF